MCANLMDTVFPQIRPAGIIFLQGLQLRVLLEWGHYSRAGIIIRTNLDRDINPRNPDIFIIKIGICVIKNKQSAYTVQKM